MFDEKFIEGWENAKANGLGTNEKLKFDHTDADKLRKFGFLMFGSIFDIPPHWHWHGFVTKSVSLDINYYVKPYKGAQLQILTIDEDYCQPYDYQYLLKNNPHLDYALRVFERVEAHMKLLADAGIISGHEYGEYI